MFCQYLFYTSQECDFDVVHVYRDLCLTHPGCCKRNTWRGEWVQEWRNTKDVSAFHKMLFTCPPQWPKWLQLENMFWSQVLIEKHSNKTFLSPEWSNKKTCRRRYKEYKILLLHCKVSNQEYFCHNSNSVVIHH